MKNRYLKKIKLRKKFYAYALYAYAYTLYAYALYAYTLNAYALYNAYVKGFSMASNNF